jgi:hypothetical protein
MKSLLSVIAFLVMSSLAFAGDVAIDIEVAIAPGVVITAPQEWADRLGKLELDRAQIRSVQIRSARGDEKPSTEFNEEKTRLHVVAVLKGDVLVTAERAFRSNQIAELKTHFAKLPERITEAGIERGQMGLTESEFHAVLADLGKPLGMSTVGLSVNDVLLHCTGKFRLPVRHGAGIDLQLRTAKPMTLELKDIAAGTALAIALRREELTLRPVHVENGLELVVERYERDREVWPTGWKAKESSKQLAPKLFEALNFEIDGYTLTKALDALAPRLTVPVIMDEWVLARENIHPEKIQVKVPPKKTFLMNAVGKMLSQARLVGELLIDDAGTPFLWVTQYGPDSRPAE